MSKHYDNIDDLFRDKFSDFELEPPPHIWTNVEKSIKEGGSGSGGKLGKGGLLGLSALIIGLGSLLVFFNTPHTGNNDEALLAAADIAVENVIQNTGVNDKTADAGEIPSNSTSNDNHSGSVATPEISGDYLPNAEPNRPEVNADKGKLVTAGDLSLSVSDETHEITEKNSWIKGIFNRKAKHIPNEKSTNPGALSGRKAAQTEYRLKDGSVFRSSLQGFHENSERKGNSYFSGSKWSAGLFFTPESINLPEDNDPQRRSYSIDLHAIMNNSGFIMQTGLGLAFSEDDGNYSVNYEKYLGSYEDVYDITFDSTETGIIPTYHTQTVEVYDSVRHISISESKNRYTYLQLPFLLGYETGHKRVSWFAKAGPSLSLLIHRNIPGIDFPGRDKVIEIDERMPERISVHWQLMLSAGMSYRLSSRINLVFEPIFRYYIRSAYDQKTIQTKHPYSYGIRTGLTINF